MLNNCLIDSNNSIAKILIQVASKHSNRPAISVGKKVYSYSELFFRAKNLARRLLEYDDLSCLILSDRTLSAYIAILACLLSGKTYIFLDPKSPSNQLIDVIRLSDSKLIVFNEGASNKLQELSAELISTLTSVLINDQEDSLSSYSEDHFPNVVNQYDFPEKVSKYAYIMFTSGSTGKPKGVPITHKNLGGFLGNIIERIKPSCNDRFSHINELTFDFSIYEIFCCWATGACLCVLPDNYIYGIDKYLTDEKITFWSSVPSIITLLSQIKKLGKKKFTNIRYSVFCGEVLTQEVARVWRESAPNTIIDNLYGPTEATVAISGHIWSETCQETTVPMGFIFRNQGFLVLNSDTTEAKPGEIGELCLTGSQVSEGYWKNFEATENSFFLFHGKRFYKTGDLVAFDEKYGLIYKGRRDDQLKLKGYRVEKIEIESRLKAILGTESVAISVKKNELTRMAASLTCFFSGCILNDDQARKLAINALPAYMLPDHFIKIESLPYNKNGKLDYQNLKKITEGL